MISYAVGWCWGNWGDVVYRYKLKTSRKIYFGDLTCNTVNILIVNDIIFINLKVAKDHILTVSNTKKKYLCDRGIT